MINEPLMYYACTQECGPHTVEDYSHPKGVALGRFIGSLTFSWIFVSADHSYYFSGKSIIGAIIGGVVGAIAALLVAVVVGILVYWFCCRDMSKGRLSLWHSVLSSTVHSGYF